MGAFAYLRLVGAGSLCVEEIDVRLSAELDRGGELCPLLTRGEARAVRFALHLFGQGDGPGSQAAYEMVTRLDRRLEVMFPDEDILFGGEIDSHV